MIFVFLDAHSYGGHFGIISVEIDTFLRSWRSF
jgi:hypothetical protein